MDVFYVVNDHFDFPESFHRATLLEQEELMKHLILLSVWKIVFIKEH